jgi:tRNA(fMet)-specific endonuclease VapC
VISACVADTDVVSFVFRGSPEAQLYAPHLTGRVLLLSFMTIAELDKWALQRNWGAQRIAAMESYLSGFTTVSANRALCRMWAQIVDSERRQGRVISTADAWIAATALIHAIPLITHNRKHFERVASLYVISEK